MSAITSSEIIVADPAPARTPSPRLRLYNLMVEAGCEVVALGSQAARALVASREPDAVADRHVIAIRRQAVIGAEESAAIHGCPCWQRFRAINEHGLAAQHHDALEDGLIARAAAFVHRIAEIGRAMNRALEHELSKRGRGRA